MREAPPTFPLFPLAAFARAEGFPSERAAREVLHRGLPGYLLIGDRVFPLTQHALERLLRATGVNPWPEQDDDEREAAAELARQERETAKSDERGRKRYAAMCEARGEGVESVIYR